MGWRKNLDNGWAMYRLVALPQRVVEECQRENEKIGVHGHITPAYGERDFADPLGASEGAGDADEGDWLDPLGDYAGPKLRLLDAKQADSTYSVMRDADSDDDSRQKKRLQKLREQGEYRKLATLPERWEECLITRFRKRFPNFHEVIDYLHGMFALAAMEDGVPRFDPILLSGPPGVGKTFFAELLAGALGTPCVTIRMENAQDNCALTGSSDFWSNTKEGQLFSSLVGGEVANPVFFLDEVDKVGDGLRYDPLSSLYSLLEPRTAQTFCDLSFPWLKLNASGVLWLATANDAELLPAPLLSRFRHFRIPSPTPSQAKRLVQYIFEDVRSDLPRAAAGFALSRGALDVLSTLAPRLIKRHLREAVGRCVIANRTRITKRDVRADSQVRANGIGFLALGSYAERD